MKLIAIISVVLAGAPAACSRETTSPAPAPGPPSTSPTAARGLPAATQLATATELPTGMVRVPDPSQVCMVNNQFMGKPQIPVEVEGRTYFGCCAMCKERLNKDASARTATDPVTGEQVDKASAVIVQDASGKVLYFASEDTLRRYRG